MLEATSHDLGSDVIRQVSQSCPPDGVCRLDFVVAKNETHPPFERRD